MRARFYMLLTQGAYDQEIFSPNAPFLMLLFLVSQIASLKWPLYHASHICAPIATSLLKSSSRRAIAVSCFLFPSLSMMRSPSAISLFVAQPTTNLDFHPRPPTFLISYPNCQQLQKG